MGRISKFYFNQLSNQQKQIYSMIHDGLSAYVNEIVLPLTPTMNLSSIYNAVLLDNPFFYFAPTFRYIKNASRQRIVLIPAYNYSGDVIAQYATAMRSYLHMFDWLKSKSQVEKELYVHDFCLENFSYDYSFNNHSFSPIGLLVNRIGVCAGISKLVKILLDYLGVECMLVTGKAIGAVNQKPELHMWNIVAIAGNTYHLDVTFDMSQKSRINRYDYFNLSDIEIKRDHFLTAVMPKCKISGRDYYSANSLVAHNLHELESIISKSFSSNKNPVIVKLNDCNLISKGNALDEIMEVAWRHYKMPILGEVSLDVSYNPFQQIYELNFT